MGGHVLIVDRDRTRREALRTALEPTGGEVLDLDDPARLAARIAVERPDLLVLDLDGLDALEALIRLRASSGAPLPVLALVPSGSADLRLAALRAGADEVTTRDAAPRLLQARLRSLLRHREADLESDLRDDGHLALTGLSESPSAFLHAHAATPAAVARPRVGLLSAERSGTVLPADSLQGHLDADLSPLPADPGAGGQDLDLVVIDAAGTRGDLAQGARVLALLAELRGRPRTRQAATLLLLPDSAIETAALALDLGAGDVVTGPASPEEIALRASALIARRRQSESLRDRLRLGLREALTDPLTSLPNRRHADSVLRRLSEGARLTGRGFALMMLDIDHFKSINDCHGHAAGDRVLVEVARRLQSHLRPSDLLARVGGEEFLLALPDTTAEEAALIADRLRRAVGGPPFVLDRRPPPGKCLPSPECWDEGHDLLTCVRRGTICPLERGEGAGEVHVTVSIGISATPTRAAGPIPSLAGLLRRADDALYAAKRAGRNAVATAPEAA